MPFCRLCARRQMNCCRRPNIVQDELPLRRLAAKRVETPNGGGAVRCIEVNRGTQLTGLSFGLSTRSHPFCRVRDILRLAGQGFRKVQSIEDAAPGKRPLGRDVVYHARSCEDFDIRAQLAVAGFGERRR